MLSHYIHAYNQKEIFNCHRSLSAELFNFSFRDLPVKALHSFQKESINYSKQL